MSSLPATPRWPLEHPETPHIADDEDFGELVRKLSFYFTEAIQLPHAFEELRSQPCGRILYPLISSLSDHVHHPAVVSALLYDSLRIQINASGPGRRALKTHFSALEEASDEPGVNQGRGYACEFVAWQFLTNLSEREAIDFLLYELPSNASTTLQSSDAEQVGALGHNGNVNGTSNEQTPLLGSSVNGAPSNFGTDTVVDTTTGPPQSDDFTSQFENLSALEIACVSQSKKFLSQRPVQKIINAVWRGDIVFWETLSVNSVKCPKLYNRRRADPFCRLRVPRYLKIFETVFFATFLALYYVVLVKRSFTHVTPAEILLYVWIAGFAYDEFGEWVDAGQTSFYASDFWWTWDISIVIVGLVFFILRIIGLTMSSNDIIDLSYDVLGLAALFLVPRIFALLSLNPYFGTLIPCLKEMTKDFVKFLSLVIILYLGFLTTFVLLARDQFTPRDMSWILIKVFFGSSYLGFDVAQEISPYFGPPIMLVFVALTNILLITSLISLLSNSLTKHAVRNEIRTMRGRVLLFGPLLIEKVLDHAREEYLFVYSVYVLEASSSNRLTYYLPPLNLIPLLLRPLRLVLPSERLRSARIVLLKATHAPYVGVIWAYEQLAGRKRTSGMVSISGPETPTPTSTKRPLRSTINPPRPLTAGFQAEARSYFPVRPQTRGSEPDPQLKSLVLKLSSQVEELTAMVSQLQERNEASTAAG